MHKSFTSLVKFIPTYFILLDCIIDEIIFLISLSDCYLLVYTTYLYMLILYPVLLCVCVEHFLHITSCHL